MKDEFWTAKDLADAAGVTDSQIRRLLGQGKLDGAFKLTGAWLVPADVGAAWVKEHWARKWARSVRESENV